MLTREIPAASDWGKSLAYYFFRILWAPQRDLLIERTKASIVR
jgi:hypothetical protein